MFVTDEIRSLVQYKQTKNVRTGMTNTEINVVHDL